MKLPGEDVPTIGDIAQAHGVSVSTAHRAFTQFKNDGLIEVSRGRRAVVRSVQLHRVGESLRREPEGC
ncbi:helix-turn-helix domain-containing protein [Streptomyces sp. NL15-2K]|uniref:helix-turn-helix domain-containing protein n=1 Tax=Streptomyces sp. NL15-2K TaxID=376149 RepID=UPI000FF989E0|nr:MULTISPECIES: GntR family transcriptional regulator [Actinomycetes]WKX09993.1 GntR family transcriptional regulator [Kutzneria buriramensis]GCB48463.1 hypothetical protein SNL152K_5787 [Streptomyces sp. NL15-2K]